ncbi:hypothetical protein GCM10011608_60160 [Micromonospora sonchi]|uniref:Uncharacterized protein n=1 Tax=Micromonospora sonchi TaxID=1763543 RepID=A0A917U9B8_9ACTN|nr:hypothetical protein GCM10011608_60160 [Micromonospora sonchi]
MRPASIAIVKVLPRWLRAGTGRGFGATNKPDAVPGDPTPGHCIQSMGCAVGAGEGPAAHLKPLRKVIAMRIKWFVPSNVEQPFKPFGIGCQRRGTLSTHCGESARTGCSDMVRAKLDRPSPATGRRRHSGRGRTRP